MPATPDGERRRAAIATALGHLTAFDLARIGPVQTAEVAEEDWSNAWKDYYHPIRFGRRIVVKPSWRQIEAGPHDVVIEIDPGMAFGTGLHQTTAMCLELIEDYVRPASVVLDQGTGSGILALAAARLGAARVDAVDKSEVAVAAARENVVRNGLGHVIGVIQSADVPAASGRGYDVVLANIIANVIVDLADRFAAALEPGGRLIASGIIRDREDNVRAALREAGLTVDRREIRDEWIALVGAKQWTTSES